MSTSVNARPTIARRRGAWVHVLDVLDGLGEGLDPTAFAAAHQHAIAKSVTVGGGERGSTTIELERQEHDLLVCAGFLLREIAVDGRVIAELVGPGDVLLSPAYTSALPSCDVTWRTVGAVQLALLDSEFTRRAAPWPGLLVALLRRAGDRAARSSAERAMLAVPNVELRILLFLSHYATQWGRVGSDGFVVPVAMTHAMIGALVGARRPTVTTAIGRLRARGALDQREDRGWLLRARGAAELSGHVLAASETRGRAAEPPVPLPPEPAPSPPAAPGVPAPMTPVPSNVLSRRLEDQRLRLAHVRERHEAALATMRDRADVLVVRTEALRDGLRDAQRNGGRDRR